MLHALSVGINRHVDGRIPGLRFGRSDAQALTSVLAERLGPRVHSTVLLDERATKRAIAHELTCELPRRIHAADTVLVHFAGYGCPDVDAAATEHSLHLLTTDTDYADVFGTSINLASELGEWTRRLSARLVVVVLDAAFSGTGGGRTLEGPGLRAGPRLRRRTPPSLSRFSVGPRCAVWMAATDDEVVAEDPTLAHGALTHAFMAALSGATSAADLRPSSLHGVISSEVGARTEGRQHPVLLQGAHADEALFRVPDPLFRSATFSRPSEPLLVAADSKTRLPGSA